MSSSGSEIGSIKPPISCTLGYVVKESNAIYGMQWRRRRRLRCNIVMKRSVEKMKITNGKMIPVPDPDPPHAVDNRE